MGSGFGVFVGRPLVNPVWGSDQNSFACSPGGLISLTSIKLIAVAAASSICNRTAGFRVSYGRHRLCPARSGCPQPSQTWRRYPAQVPHAESGVFSSSSSVRSSRNHNPAWTCVGAAAPQNRSSVPARYAGPSPQSRRWRCAVRRRRSPSRETAQARPNGIPASSHAAGSSASGAASTRAVRLGLPDRSGRADRRGVSAGWAARHASS